MPAASEARLGLWRDYSRRYLDREQTSGFERNKR